MNVVPQTLENHAKRENISKFKFLFSQNLGPRLPVERSSYTMVANPAGDGILMLGGFQNSNYSKEVYQMKCQKDGIKTSCHWTRFPNDLPTVRSGFTAFYVPEKAMQCDSI